MREQARTTIHDAVQAGVSLVRVDRPFLAALHAPAAGATFTAVAGEGSQLNGVPVQASEMTDFSVAWRALVSPNPTAARRTHSGSTPLSPR